MTTYAAKTSATRAAKKAHGDNWAEVCKVVMVGDRFEIKMLQVESDPAKVLEQLQAGLNVLQAGKPKKASNIRQLVPLSGDKSKATVINMTPTLGENRSAGRPISPDQIKVRRRLVEFMRKQGDGQFTVKDATKTLKLKRMHVSNAMRWAKNSGLVKSVGFKPNENSRAGRKDLLFVVVALPAPEAEAA